MQPGYKTTEFWLTLGVVVVGAVLTHAETVPGSYGYLAMAVLAGIYTFLRAALKGQGPKR
jgi:hypothetical protein